MGVQIDVSPRADLDEPPELDGPPRDLHGALVADRVRQLRADRDARAILAAEAQQPAVPFDAGTLAEVLARPPEPRSRVESLIPWESSTLVVAQRKTGKTTFVLNLARSLLTGEPFLGRLDVQPVRGTVGLLNFEVSGAQVARWADEVGVPPDRLFLVNLRGRRNPFTDPDERGRLAGLLRRVGVESLIVDPFGRAYPGHDQNATGEVSAWLVDLDRFARAEAGARDLILCAHAGWNGERTRGSSALEDWPDSIITLTRDENTGERYLRAMGRDVDLDEDRLDFDPESRGLTLAGAGNRRDAAAERLDTETRDAIMRLLERHSAGLSGKELAELASRKDAAFTRVRDALVGAGEVHQVKRSGRGGGWLYALNQPNLPNMPEPAEPATTNLPNLPPIEGEVLVREVQPGTCRTCEQPLHPVVIADGFDTCPGCETAR